MDVSNLGSFWRIRKKMRFKFCLLSNRFFFIVNYAKVETILVKTSFRNILLLMCCKNTLGVVT